MGCRRCLKLAHIAIRFLVTLLCVSEIAGARHSYLAGIVVKGWTRPRLLGHLFMKEWRDEDAVSHIAIRFLLLCLTEIAGARHRLVAGIVIVTIVLITIITSSITIVKG